MIRVYTVPDSDVHIMQLMGQIQAIAVRRSRIQYCTLKLVMKHFGGWTLDGGSYRLYHR